MQVLPTEERNYQLYPRQSAVIAKAKALAQEDGKGRYISFLDLSLNSATISKEPPGADPAWNQMYYIPAPDEGSPTEQEVLDLYNEVQEFHNKGEFDHDKELRFLAQAKALDTRAKLAHGEGNVATGRIYRTHVADGFAEYLIWQVKKSTVRVLHLPLFDGYTDRAVSPNGNITKRLVKTSIQYDDAMERYLSQTLVPE
jgi:hypothetical protein